MRTSPARRKNVFFNWWPHTNFSKVFKVAENSGSFGRKSGVPRIFWAFTAQCSRSTKSSLVKNLISLGATPRCCRGDSRTGNAVGGDGKRDSAFSAAGKICTCNGICNGWGAATPTNYSFLANFNFIIKNFFIKIIVFHPSSTKLHNMNLRPPFFVPTPFLC